MLCCRPPAVGKFYKASSTTDGAIRAHHYSPAPIGLELKGKRRAAPSDDQQQQQQPLFLISFHPVAAQTIKLWPRKACVLCNWRSLTKSTATRSHEWNAGDSGKRRKFLVVQGHALKENVVDAVDTLMAEKECEKRCAELARKDTQNALRHSSSSAWRLWRRSDGFG